MFLRFLLAGSFSALFPVEIFRIQIDIDIYLCFWRSFLWRIFGNFFGQFIFRHDSCLFKILLVDLNFRLDRRIRRWLCLPLFLGPFFFSISRLRSSIRFRYLSVSARFCRCPFRSDWSLLTTSFFFLKFFIGILINLLHGIRCPLHDFLYMPQCLIGIHNRRSIHILRFPAGIF